MKKCGFALALACAFALSACDGGSAPLPKADPPPSKERPFNPGDRR